MRDKKTGRGRKRGKKSEGARNAHTDAQQHTSNLYKEVLRLQACLCCPAPVWACGQRRLTLLWFWWQITAHTPLCPERTEQIKRNEPPGDTDLGPLHELSTSAGMCRDRQRAMHGWEQK